MAHSARRQPNRAFTLVELMVSLAIVILLLIMLVQITNQTSKTWRYTTSKIEQFREAQTAFETMTRRISQATLNTYWDYHFTDPKNRVGPTAYIRQSELRFVSGSMQNKTGGGTALNADATALRPTHGVFFQAPLGYVAPTSTQDASDQNYENLHGLDNLLNTWGYYIEVNDDQNIGARPPLFNSTFPGLRVRSRLMELMQPSNQLTIYADTLPDEYSQTSSNAAKFDWFTQTLNATQPPAANSVPGYHVLAENIIALILLPKLSKQDQTTHNFANGEASLAPNYYYNSATAGASNSADDSTKYLNSKNQLPPVIQVTMIAIDEASANRVMPTQAQAAQLMTSLQLDGAGNRFTSALNNGYHTDLEATSSSTSLESDLIAKKINYRIFSTNVSIRGAKWSQSQTQ